MMYGVPVYKSFADVPYPFQERWWEYRGCRICYIDEGSGPSVLFLPAFGRGLTHYEMNYPAFTARHRVIGVDMPGWGKSDKPDIDYDLDYFMKFLSAFAAELGLTAPALVGASGGGVLAAEYAIRAPVSALVLVGVSGMRRNLLARRIFDQKQLLKIDEAMWRKNVARNFAGDHPMVSVIVERALALSKTPEWPLYARALARAGKTLEALDFERDLPRVSVPTLVLWGEKDEVCPLSWGKKVASKIPGARLTVVPNTGHFVNMEAPERFAQEILGFLGGLTGHPSSV